MQERAFILSKNKRSKIRPCVFSDEGAQLFAETGRYDRAAGRIRSILAGISLDHFAGDWQKRWLIERGLEIISEASRHLPEAMKLRRPEIPWLPRSSLFDLPLWRPRLSD
ncbi:MAG TPA: HepT-like ribonuclease domain-containing protein [Methylocella sp.]|nr:HepT-like ribonuclease domain-containing protein [Methylocella sp.]